jgi:hypothetical protein
MELIKRVGKQLIEGKDVVSVSLPVRIFEPRSTIERICDNWAFLPYYLKMAANTSVRLEVGLNDNNLEFLILFSLGSCGKV